jgi:hypothetical protein
MVFPKAAPKSSFAKQKFCSGSCLGRLGLPDTMAHVWGHSRTVGSEHCRPVKAPGPPGPVRNRGEGRVPGTDGQFVQNRSAPVLHTNSRFRNPVEDTIFSFLSQRLARRQRHTLVCSSRDSWDTCRPVQVKASTWTSRARSVASNGTGAGLRDPAPKSFPQTHPF